MTVRWWFGALCALAFACGRDMAGAAPQPPPPSPSPSPSPGPPPPATTSKGSDDGAPYRAIDLTPAGSGRALRVGDDGRVLYARKAGMNLTYAVYDPATKASTDLLSIPWTWTAVASAQFSILYGTPYLSNSGCSVHLRSNQGDQDLGAPPICAPLLPVAVEGPYALVEVIGGGSLATTRPPRGLLHIDGAGWVDLGTLGGESTVPSGLNAAGVVVGSSQDASGAWHAFRWEAGSMVDRGPLWGPAALAIAPDGVSALVGPQTFPDGSLHDVIVRGGASSDLGLHAEFDSMHGAALSPDATKAVGSMTAAADPATPARAFLAEGGVVYDVNSLLSSHALHISNAVSVDDRGTIAAVAFAADGTQHAAVLVRQHDPADGGGKGELPADQLVAAGQRAVALALDQDRVYWINQTGSSAGPARLEVRSIAKSGGPVAVLASTAGTSLDLAVSATHVYFTLSRCGPDCANQTSVLARVPKTGGALQILGPGEGQIALDDARAYVASPSGQISAYPFDGGAVPLAALLHPVSPSGIEVDAGHLYFDVTDVSIGSIPKAGGAVSLVATISGSWFGLDGRMKLAGARGLCFRGQGDVFCQSLAPAGGEPMWSAAGLRPDIDADGTAVYFNESPNASYWGDADGGTPFGSLGGIARIGPDGSVVRLSQSIDDYGAVRVDGRSVYYLRAHQVLAAPKP